MSKYFMTTDKHIITDVDLKKAASIVYGKDLTDTEVGMFAQACAGIACEINEADVTPEFLVEHGEIVRAVRLYYDTHNGTLREAYNYVDSIRDNMREVKV